MHFSLSEFDLLAMPKAGPAEMLSYMHQSGELLTDRLNIADSVETKRAAEINHPFLKKYYNITE